jgi:hypothetical protein
VYLVERRLFPVALPVAAFGAAPTTTPPAKALPTIAELRTKLKARMDKLRSYDLFLRDRNVIEWFKDNSAIVHWVVRSKDSRARHEESHEFWAHLDDAQKRQLVARWIDLVEAGAKLQGDAGKGGIGVGYGPNETVPPSRATAIGDWIHRADDFIGQFENKRQKMRIESRVNPPSATDFLGKALRPIAWAVGLGVVGIVAVTIWTRPRLPGRGS